MTRNMLFGMEDPSDVIFTPLTPQNEDTFESIKLYAYMESKKGNKKKDIIKTKLENDIRSLLNNIYLNDGQEFPLKHDGELFEIRV